MPEEIAEVPRRAFPAWEGLWPKALALWGFYVRLRPPLICATSEEAGKEGLDASFAMIRLTDHLIVIDAQAANRLGLEEFGLEILGHEIGHHVYCPANMEDAARMSVRIRRALYKMESFGPMVANLWTDLLINDRLQRDAGLKMERIYRALPDDGESALWRFYMRGCELLWSLPRGSLAKGEIDEQMEADARLTAGIARSWSREWPRGAGRFASLCLPYLIRDQEKAPRGPSAAFPLLDALAPGAGETGEFPSIMADEDEEGDSIHPAIEAARKGVGKSAPPLAAGAIKPGGGNARLPFEYGQILRDLGYRADEGRVVAGYYRELARPHLIRFPSVERERAAEPEAEGLGRWDPGTSLEEVSWVESALRSPFLIPGYTILEREYGVAEGGEPERRPIDLDVYVDCSGSMPDPRSELSYLALAGAIMALSALRAGARVQATLWSGPGQFSTTDGFVRDADRILGIVTGYIAGGTAFPIHILRRTYLEAKEPGRKAHIMVISDDGVTTMFDTDERGGSGCEIAARALAAAGGGGTFALNVGGDWRRDKGLLAAEKMGWAIFAVTDWEKLVAFAREFSRRVYGKTGKR